MIETLTSGELTLLDRWQRDFPLVPRPYAVLASALEIDESAVLERLEDFQSRDVECFENLVFHSVLLHPAFQPSLPLRIAGGESQKEREGGWGRSHRSRHRVSHQGRRLTMERLRPCYRSCVS